MISLGLMVVFIFCVVRFRGLACEENQRGELDSMTVSSLYFAATKIFVPHIDSDEDGA